MSHDTVPVKPIKPKMLKDPRNPIFKKKNFHAIYMTTAMLLSYLHENDMRLQLDVTEQRPKANVTVSACYFCAKMTVTWLSAYIVFALSRSV